MKAVGMFFHSLGILLYLCVVVISPLSGIHVEGHQGHESIAIAHHPDSGDGNALLFIHELLFSHLSKKGDWLQSGMTQQIPGRHSLRAATGQSFLKFVMADTEAASSGKDGRFRFHSVFISASSGRPGSCNNFASLFSGSSPPAFSLPLPGSVSYGIL